VDATRHHYGHHLRPVVLCLGLVVRASRNSLSSLSGELLFVLLYFYNSHSLLRSRVSAHREITPNTTNELEKVIIHNIPPTLDDEDAAELKRFRRFTKIK
jgi:hypothetical protein